MRTDDRMASAHRRRRLLASQQELWGVIADPHHLPRWWPGVERVEGVGDGRFTQVLRTKRGRPVRADFHVLESDQPWRRAWEQELPGTPFARVLSESVIEAHLQPLPSGSGTEVTIAQRQKLRGYSRAGGSFFFRRAMGKRLEEALEDLGRVCD
jgi:carbon monoxide dehydrogenase subunit G